MNVSYFTLVNIFDNIKMHVWNFEINVELFHTHFNVLNIKSVTVYINPNTYNCTMFKLPSLHGIQELGCWNCVYYNNNKHCLINNCPLNRP